MADTVPAAPDPLRGRAAMAVAPQSAPLATTDSPVAHDNVCPHCGQAAPPGALAGLCPACLLRQGAAGDTGFSSVVSPPSVEELTELFPQLEILGLIGTGGMGAVYKARQRELDRMVALKILPPGIGDRPGFAERFTREAKALAKLSHPGIVTIHDTGRVHGLYYLLMEFVDGLNLRQLIDRGRVSPREALVIVPMICDALQYAHDKGIVHRDIKPENILLDRQGRVKVADFGLAKLVGADELELFPTSTTAPFVTQAGQLMGTLQYMAPEQIERPGEVDHRADIYSLGVVLYQMLTGELPDQNLEPPSRKVLLDIRLDEVVLRALEQNPDHRYQQVSQIKQSVETLITSSNSEPPEGDPAMEIRFTCPHCSQILAVDDSLAGSQVSCPTCSQTMLVPPLHAAPNLRAPARQAPQTQRSSPGGHAPAAQRARGLAIWSLVLALIGLVPVLGLATGAIGLLLGIVALAKDTTSKGMAIAGTVIGGVAVLVIPLHLALLNTSLSAAKFATGTMACANNLNTIGQGIETYRQQNNSTYPPDLETLVREGILRDDDLRCPLHEGGNGYMYSRPAGLQASGLMVWDRFPHRSPGDAVMGRNVVNTELQVSFLTEPQFRGAARAGSSGTAPTGQGSAPVVTQRPDRTRPTTPAPPPQPEVTVASVIASLASTPPKEQRPLLQFLARATPTPEQRPAVIAAVKPLLNDVDNSEAAFQVFAAWADTDEVPDLIEMVRIAPGSPRGRESMKLLSRLGDARATTVLAASLADRGAARDAKAALAALGAIAKPSVLRLYHHENSFTRETARELLRGYNTTGEEILAESIRTLAEGGVESRRSALFELPKTELSAEKRVEVARALHPLITDSEPGVRDPARNAMKTLATPADADFLLSLMQSEDQDARKLATELLVAFKDVRAAPPLAVWLADPHETYRAGTHLIALGSMAEPAVIPYLRHEEPLTRQRAADVLAKIGTTASLRALEANANDSNFFAKAAAETAIAAIKGRSPAAFQR